MKKVLCVLLASLMLAGCSSRITNDEQFEKLREQRTSLKNDGFSVKETEKENAEGFIATKNSVKIESLYFKTPEECDSEYNINKSAISETFKEEFEDGSYKEGTNGNNAYYCYNDMLVYSINHKDNYYIQASCDTVDIEDMSDALSGIGDYIDIEKTAK